MHGTGLLLTFWMVSLHSDEEPAAGPAAEDRLHRLDRNALFRQQLFQNVQHALPGALTVGRVRHIASLDLGADALGIAHLIAVAGLEDLGKKALCVPVFPVLGVQVTAAFLELGPLDGQDGLPHTPDSLLPIVHVFPPKIFRHSLCQRPPERRSSR